MNILQYILMIFSGCCSAAELQNVVDGHYNFNLELTRKYNVESRKGIPFDPGEDVSLAKFIWKFTNEIVVTWPAIKITSMDETGLDEFTVVKTEQADGFLIVYFDHKDKDGGVFHNVMDVKYDNDGRLLVRGAKDGAGYYCYTIYDKK